MVRKEPLVGAKKTKGKEAEVSIPLPLCVSKVKAISTIHKDLKTCISNLVKFKHAAHTPSLLKIAAILRAQMGTTRLLLEPGALAIPPGLRARFSLVVERWLDSALSFFFSFFFFLFSFFTRGCRERWSPS